MCEVAFELYIPYMVLSVIVLNDTCIYKYIILYAYAYVYEYIHTHTYTRTYIHINYVPLFEYNFLGSSCFSAVRSVDKLAIQR